MSLVSTTPSTIIRPPLIGRRAVALLRNPDHRIHIPSLFPVHTKKNIRFSRSRPPISSAADSSGSASTTTYEDITSSLEKVEVFDLTGKAVPIVDLWRDRKAVVAFARHFGCVLCRKRADVLASKKHLMDAAGAALILIAPGTVDQFLCRHADERTLLKNNYFIYWQSILNETVVTAAMS